MPISLTLLPSCTTIRQPASQLESVAPHDNCCYCCCWSDVSRVASFGLLRLPISSLTRLLARSCCSIQRQNEWSLFASSYRIVSIRFVSFLHLLFSLCIFSRASRSFAPSLAWAWARDLMNYIIAMKPPRIESIWCKMNQYYFERELRTERESNERSLPFTKSAHRLPPQSSCAAGEEKEEKRTISVCSVLFSSVRFDMMLQLVRSLCLGAIIIEFAI